MCRNKKETEPSDAGRQTYRSAGPFPYLITSSGRVSGISYSRVSVLLLPHPPPAAATVDPFIRELPRPSKKSRKKEDGTLFFLFSSQRFWCQKSCSDTFTKGQSMICQTSPGFGIIRGDDLLLWTGCPVLIRA